MELEELKNVWTSMNERLEKQELLKESIIRKLCVETSGKSLNRLLNYEIFGAIVCLLVSPVLPFIQPVLVKINATAGNIFVYGTLSLIILIVCWQIFKITGLMKIDFTKSVSHNLRCINRYRIWINKEKIAMIPLILIISAACIYWHVYIRVTVALWMFLVGGLISAIFLVWYLYIKLYDKNIASIRSTLDELKELDGE
jgi:hypothetical protein